MKRISILVAIATIALTMATTSQVQAGAAQQDALQCIKIKEANKTVGGIVDLQAYTSSTDCEVKGAATACVPASVNGGDDARGGPFTATGYICFKAKCKNETSPVMNSTPNTQFGPIDMSGDFVKGTKTLCVPYGF